MGNSKVCDTRRKKFLFYIYTNISFCNVLNFLEHYATSRHKFSAEKCKHRHPQLDFTYGKSLENNKSRQSWDRFLAMEWSGCLVALFGKLTYLAIWNVAQKNLPVCRFWEIHFRFLFFGAFTYLCGRPDYGTYGTTKNCFAP